MTAFQDDHPSEDAARCTVATASSRFDALSTAGVLSPLGLDQVWRVGSLRNDLLLRGSDALPADLVQQERWLIEELDGRRLVLLSLASAVDTEWRDGGAFCEDHLKWLAGWAERQGVVLGFQDIVGDRTRQLSRILRPLGAWDLPRRRFPYAEILLRVASAVVTDHSQAGVDFSATGKPMVSLHGGQSTDPPLLHDLEVVLPGAVCRDTASFEVAMEGLFEPLGAERRHLDGWRRDLLFEHLDDQNARRLVRRVKELYVC